MKQILVFIAGLSLGAGVSWVYHKNKYEEMVQEEVESLREHRKSKLADKDMENVEETQMEPIEEEEEDNSDEYIEKVEKIINYQKYSTPNTDEHESKYKKPYIVTPDDFASVPGFDTDTFYYHHDDIISNDRNEMVDDVETILGLSVEEIRDQFGVYEDDAVYIRNMRLKCDYEVLREESNFRRNGD
jgi:hypothetical protein